MIEVTVRIVIMQHRRFHVSFGDLCLKIEWTIIIIESDDPIKYKCILVQKFV